MVECFWCGDWISRKNKCHSNCEYYEMHDPGQAIERGRKKALKDIKEMKRRKRWPVPQLK